MSTRIAATVERPSKSRRRNVPCYARLVKGEDVHERIQKLLVTGDNRLKQGVDPQKARESWEQALLIAREAGLEDGGRPLVEVSLAGLPPRASAPPGSSRPAVSRRARRRPHGPRRSGSGTSRPSRARV